MGQVVECIRGMEIEQSISSISGLAASVIIKASCRQIVFPPFSYVYTDEVDPVRITCVVLYGRVCVVSILQPNVVVSIRKRVKILPIYGAFV